TRRRSPWPTAAPPRGTASASSRSPAAPSTTRATWAFLQRRPTPSASQALNVEARSHLGRGPPRISALRHNSRGPTWWPPPAFDVAKGSVVVRPVPARVGGALRAPSGAGARGAGASGAVGGEEEDVYLPALPDAATA